MTKPLSIPAARTPFALAFRRFRKNRMGMMSAGILLTLYLITLLAGFIAPYNITVHHDDHAYQPPQKIHLIHQGKLQRPFVYPYQKSRDPITFATTFQPNKRKPISIYFLVRGQDRNEYQYSFLGLFKSQWHLFGVKEEHFFPLGTDKFGRDLLSRTLVGSQVSLTVGLVGIFISFSIGILVGGISGYFSGWIDNLTQRIIEVLLSFPRLPILLALSSILPASLPSTWMYLGIVAVLALIGWANLARVIRGQVLAVRDLEYIHAARSLGSSDLRIILRHIIPNISSLLIIMATLALPGYILGESALSFLGLGIREPMTSWGLLLKDAQKFETLSLYPWLLFPGLMIVTSVLAFNFLGDALRDAVDTRSQIS